MITFVDSPGGRVMTTFDGTLVDQKGGDGRIGFVQSCGGKFVILFVGAVGSNGLVGTIDCE
jgi:hypothetical protein